MVRRIISTALIFLLAAFANSTGLVRPLQHWLTELRMDLSPRAPSGDVVLVDIDAKSIAAVGSWPWPRRVHAELADRLIALGAAEVAFDVDFSLPSNADDDAAFQAALERAGGSVILAAFVQKQTAAADSRLVLSQPIDQFARDAWIASVNIHQDHDAKVRSFPYSILVDGQLIPSIPAMLGGGFGGAGREFPIDFSIDAGGIDRIPVIDVLNDAVAPDRVSGKKVIVGAQATELQDFYTVPVAGVVSGALLQAIATETIQQGRILQKSGDIVALAGILIIALAALAIGRLRWQIMIGAAALAGLSVEAAASILQARSTVAIETAPWLAGLIGFAIAVMVCEIGFQDLLRRVWHMRADNAELVLSQVVTDNFAGVLVIDEDGLIRAGSQTAARMLDRNHSLTGYRAPDILPLALSLRVEAAFSDSVAATGAKTDGEVPVARADGSERLFEYVITRSQVKRDPGRLRRKKRRHIACLTFSDITERRAAEAKIDHMARFDSLTDLPNRNQLHEQLQEEVDRCRAGSGASAVVSFDLDGFKNVNDTLGHTVGDMLLCAVADRACALLPEDALVARFGGDEFAALICGDDAGRQARDYAQQLVEQIARPFDVDGHRIIVGTSAGVATVEPGDAGADDPLMRSDTALYRAKAGGGSKFVVFEPNMLTVIKERRLVERDLLPALERDQFEIWYQPQVSLRDGEIIGAEALLRWRHPDRGLVPPSEFIPVAEAIGMIDEIGQWVLETACAEAASWPSPINLAVNVSSVQFARSDMVGAISRVLAESGLAPSRLDLEITESLFLQSSAALNETLTAVRETGAGLALDDFGTGYSSLGYLHRFPVSKIKIDRSFVSGLPLDRDAAAIVRAVAALAENLGIRLNAEGIETDEQGLFLRMLGVREGQGYLHGRPQPAVEFVARMSAAPPTKALIA